MKKTIIFITGTNCSGKTTLAKELAERYGGFFHHEKKSTFTKNYEIGFAGRYSEGSKFGGVDSLNCTSILKGIVTQILTKTDLCICEGSYMNSFGINLTNAIFQSERQIIVNLITNQNEIIKRLSLRAPEKKGITKIGLVLKKQDNSIKSYQKWKSIGVKCLQFNTSITSTKEIADVIIKML